MYIFQITINEREFNALFNAAIKSGFLREDPKKSWTVAERRSAIRWALARLIEGVED
jgi:hypothetical protein